MRKASVFRNKERVGTLIEENRNSYVFAYADDWYLDNSKPKISLTLPKSQQLFRTNHLFPFFFNLLSEGMNKQIQCRMLKIDENDHFGLLLATAHHDTPGAVTIEPLDA